MKSNSIDYGYYSRVLNKPFNTIEELKEAEEEYNKEQEKKNLAVTEKKTLAHAIEDAYKDYLTVIEQGNKEISDVQEKVRKQIAEAKNVYIEKKNDFIDKYGSYHMTYNNKEAKVDDNTNSLTTTSFIDDFFDAFRMFPWR